MKNLQEQETSTCIPFERKFYALQFEFETFSPFFNGSKILLV